MEQLCHLVYGRVEPPLLSGRFPKPGFQLVGHSSEIGADFAKQITESIVFQANDCLRYWDTQNEPTLPVMWSYRPLNRTTYIITKTLILKDKELLDRNNRDAPVTHAIIFTDSIFEQVDFNPFQLIDHSESLFISQAEDILQLKESGYESDENLVNEVLRADPDAIGERVDWDKEVLKDLFLTQQKFRTKSPDHAAKITGKSDDIKSFLSSVFRMLPFNWRQTVSFTMNPGFEGYFFETGEAKSSQIAVDASEKKVTMPRTADSDGGVFFWKKWEAKYVDLDFEQTLEHLPTVIALCEFKWGQPLQIERDADANLELIDYYWDLHHHEIAKKIYEKLLEFFSEEFANPFADFLLEHYQSAARRAEAMQQWMLNSESQICDLVYCWMAEIQGNIVTIALKSDWKTLLEMATENQHWQLLFVVASLGLSKRSQVKQALDHLSQSDFEELLNDFYCVPPSFFVHPVHVDALVESLSTSRWSDRILFETLRLTAKYQSLQWPESLRMRVQRMPPKYFRKLEKLADFS